MLRVLTIILFYIYYCDAKTECPPKYGMKQNCVQISQCDYMMKLVQNLTPERQTTLKQAFCGHNGSTPMVCCPLLNCVTPEGAQGTCEPVSSCPHVVTMLQAKPLPPSTIQYVQSLRCTGSKEHRVCCAPSPTIKPVPTTPPRDLNGKCLLYATPPDPSTKCCGIDGGGNRIFGGRETAVDEYPWLGIIEYEKNHTIQLGCGAVLISGRYVLTASHCVAGAILDYGTPVNVRLGEYDTSVSGPDCAEVEGGGIDCTDGEEIVPIETTIAHPEYNPSSKQQRHDIALIRLARVVEYTDFIRPICLPSTDFTEAPPATLNLYVAGWGAVSKTQRSSNVKLAVTLPYVSNQDCQSSYAAERFNVQLWDGQICAGGVSGKDSCNGDSGGPLLRENGEIKELVGVVSFGPEICGTENVPGVYTKVYKYLPWIRSQIYE